MKSLITFLRLNPVTNPVLILAFLSKAFYLSEEFSPLSMVLLQFSQTTNLAFLQPSLGCTSSGPSLSLPICPIISSSYLPPITTPTPMLPIPHNVQLPSAHTHLVVPTDTPKSACNKPIIPSISSLETFPFSETAVITRPTFIVQIPPRPHLLTSFQNKYFQNYLLKCQLDSSFLYDYTTLHFI